MSKKLSNLIYFCLAAVIAVLAISTAVLAVANSKKQKYISSAANETYDFYMTLGTMPTLYATLNAYQNKNPNTYMWFYRGNTISKQYSADFIHYFSSQADDNGYSDTDYLEIRNKIRELHKKNHAAKFHLYCDDLRVRFILEFVIAGIEFENLQVTFLSDGTGSYSLYQNLTEETYASQKESWEEILQDYRSNRKNKNYERFVSEQAMELQEYAFYLSTFDNVTYWVQHPDYLVNENSESLNRDRYKMNIIQKDPKSIYLGLDDTTRADYQKVVLANALVDSDTLNTLDDAVTYFDGALSGRDKPVVLILGTSYDGLTPNKDYIDMVIDFYTPKKTEDNKATYKGEEYPIRADNTIIDNEGRKLKLEEIGVYLFFKGHPAHPANAELQEYFAENNITVLPHRTPVEVLFWMYDVKAGGYESTSFLSCYKGQTEFIFGGFESSVLIQMHNLGFFENTTYFRILTEE